MITRQRTTRRQKRSAAEEVWILPVMGTGKKQDAVSIFKDNAASFSAHSDNHEETT